MCWLSGWLAGSPHRAPPAHLSTEQSDRSRAGTTLHASISTMHVLNPAVFTLKSLSHHLCCCSNVTFSTLVTKATSHRVWHQPLFRKFSIKWIANYKHLSLYAVRTLIPKVQCSAAGCGAPLVMTWTWWWNTVCCLSSTMEIGSCSATLEPTLSASLFAPLIRPHHLYSTLSPLVTGKDFTGVSTNP